MQVEFKARRYLGELYNKHLNDKHGDFSEELSINGEYVALFLHKFLHSSSVEMEIHTQGLRYRYMYTGDTTKIFDIFELKPLGAISLADDN